MLHIFNDGAHNASHLKCADVNGDLFWQEHPFGETLLLQYVEFLKKETVWPENKCTNV